MGNSIFIGLLQNVAILLGFTMLYESIWLKKENTKSVLSKFVSGIILGGIGIVLMYTPWTLASGLVFDARSVMLSISGLFFGPIPTIIAMIMTGSLRYSMGGDGVWMGIAVIISSGTLGLLWGKFRANWQQKNIYFELIALGLAVHTSMLGCTIFLPSEVMLPTIKRIILPLFLIYSPATMLLGVLMYKQSVNANSRLMKEKFYESERRLTTILKSGNIVSIILDKNGDIVFANKYLLDITGYTFEEIEHKNWFEIFVPSKIKIDLKLLFVNFIHGDIEYDQTENEIIDKNGMTLVISWHNTILYDENNNPSGVASIGVNFTEQRNYEAKLKEVNSELEEKNIQYRNLNQELLISKGKAEESDRLKTAFLANLSHEIRTPMNAIMGFTELLNEPDLVSDERESYIKIVHISGNHLLSIISDIIEISKIEAKQVVISKSVVDLEKVMRDLHDECKDLIPNDKPVELSLIASNSDKKIIVVDEIKLHQIFMNLISNAIKFTEKGKISLGYRFVDDAIIQFEVADTGIGIKPEHQGVIFDRFRQIEGADGMSKGGSGLGLAISKAYVELMGGKIHVESTVGSGSKFVFTLPYDNVQSYR